jgi:hypothetical protein
MLKKYVLFAGFLSVTLPAFADNMCASGNLANLIGTTCDISVLPPPGDGVVPALLQFTFTGWTASNYTFNDYNGAITAYGTAGEPNDFAFTVVSDGFTITGGSRSVFGSGTYPYPISSVDYGFLFYNVVDLTGLLLGLGVTDNGLTVSGSGQSSATVGADICNTPTLINLGSCPSSPDLAAFDQVYQFGGVTYNSGPQVGENTNPSSGYGDAMVYNLFAQAPGDTAAWNGTSTFSFIATPSVPEPASLLLLAGPAIFLLYRIRRTI